MLFSQVFDPLLWYIFKKNFLTAITWIATQFCTDERLTFCFQGLLSLGHIYLCIYLFIKYQYLFMSKQNKKKMTSQSAPATNKQLNEAVQLIK